MAGDGVACLCCCEIPNGVAHCNIQQNKDAPLRANGYNTTINKLIRDDKGVCHRQETTAAMVYQILQGRMAAADKRVTTMRLAAAAA